MTLSHHLSDTGESFSISQSKHLHNNPYLSYMQKQLLYILCLFCFVFSLNSIAQNNFNTTAQSSSLFNSHSLLSFSHNPNITQAQPSPGSLPLLKHAYGADVITSGSINEMPFFCALECRLRGRTGLWIKFRTGDDASYEKLIRSGRK